MISTLKFPKSKLPEHINTDQDQYWKLRNFSSSKACKAMCMLQTFDTRYELIPLQSSKSEDSGGGGRGIGSCLVSNASGGYPRSTLGGTHVLATRTGFGAFFGLPAACFMDTRKCFGVIRSVLWEYPQCVLGGFWKKRSTIRTFKIYIHTLFTVRVLVIVTNSL